MRPILEHFTENDELGLIRSGQSNSRPWGDRDTEGFIEAPHLALRSAGMDLTILAIAAAAPGLVTHGNTGSQSVVTVTEEQRMDDWVNGELRLIAADFSEPLTVSSATFRKGHAKVLTTTPTATATVTFDVTANTVVWVSHGLRSGAQVAFTTTGTLPGLTANRTYWVHTVASQHAFSVSDVPGGAAIDLSGGSGVHTGKSRPHMLVQWLSDAITSTFSITFTTGTPGVVNHTAHGLTEGSVVTFASDTSLPAELVVGTPYYVIAPATNTYNLSASAGGASIAFSTAGGTTQVTPRMIAFVAGYVHLNDRFNSYDNVHVVTPFQPISTGPYPAGTPAVPGFTLQPDVTSFADLAVVLPFAWNEGIDGHGVVGQVTVSGLTATLQGGQTIPDSIFIDGFARVGPAKGRVVSNTANTFTVASWTPAGPGVGTHDYHLHLPHWRNNPHHFTAGEGFLYPSDDMQPGGIKNVVPFAKNSPSTIYSRPRGSLVGQYVDRFPISCPAASGINATFFAQAKTASSAQMTVALGTVGDAGTLKIAWTVTTHDPVAQRVPFEMFLRPGQIVTLGGMGQTPSVDGIWRVSRVKATTTTGSEVYLAPYDPTISPLPASVTGTVPANAVVGRLAWKTVHRFSSLVEAAWRIANSVGRRVVITYLGINSSSQALRRDNSPYSTQGVYGWFDDDKHFDWTPSNPDGLAARLQRLVQFIAPRAVKATFGTSKTIKFLAADIWQGESDAIFSDGTRQLARRTFPTFANWLRDVVADAGLSPYPTGVKMPVQWAQLTHDPWELPSLPVSTTSYSGTIKGDVDGLVNGALQRMVALEGGFSASVDANASPKVSVDSAHYNGIGMAKNGKLIADAVLPMVEFALRFQLGPDAVSVANEALALIGEPSNVTQLEPTPNNTVQAKECARFMTAARNAVLQAHTWSFATRRQALLPIENTVTTWAYAYGVPADLLKVNRILPPDALDDVQTRSIQFVSPYPYRAPVVPTASETLPATQPHRIETEEGYRVLRTNQADAVAVFTVANVDFAVWSPAARQACSYYLAHLLCGGILKGREGAQVGDAMLQKCRALIAEAAADDAEFMSDTRPTDTAPWLP